MSNIRLKLKQGSFGLDKGRISEGYKSSKDSSIGLQAWVKNRLDALTGLSALMISVIKWYSILSCWHSDKFIHIWKNTGSFLGEWKK